MSPLKRLRAWWRETLYNARVRLFGRLAVEAATEGGTALHAVAMDSAEGDIQAATQRDAWTTQVARLQAIENRSRDQEYLLRQLRRNVRELDAAENRRHATPQGLGGLRLAAFGAVGQRRGFLGPLAGVQLWQALAVGWAVTFGLLGVQTARVASLKGHEREMRQDLREAGHTIDLYQQREAQYDAALQSAREQATETADALERERTRAARAAAAERRRQREIQDVLAHSPEPPAWSLRNDEPPTPPATGAN